MLRLERGDNNAWAQLYRRYEQQALAIARRICGNPQDAEDAAQEAFISMWSGKGFDPARGNARNWILTTVRHRAIDRWRKRSKGLGRSAGVDAAESVEDPCVIEDEVILRDEARSVRDAIASLPADQSAAIELTFYGGLSHREAALESSIPVGTIKGRIRLGVAKLRRELVPAAEV